MFLGAFSLAATPAIRAVVARETMITAASALRSGCAAVWRLDFSKVQRRSFCEAALVLDDSWSRSGVEELPPLLPEIAARLNHLLAAFPRAYASKQLTGAQHGSEYRQHFLPVSGNRAGGEFDPVSVARLLSGAELGSNDAFVDVGSGRGKLVMVAAATTRVGAAWGVELSPSRAAEAQRAADRLCELDALNPAERAKVRLLQGSAAEALPEEALRASHFLLALKAPRVRGGGPSQVEQLLEKLSTCRGHRRPRTLWSIGSKLPRRRGLMFTRTMALGVLSERSWRTDIAVHEYMLE